MAASQVPEPFPPEAQAVIDRLHQELNERHQELNERNQELNERNQKLQQALNECRQLVLERDLQVIQLQAQVAQRTQIQVPLGQVGQIHEAVTAVQGTVTEIHGMIASQNDTAMTRGIKRTHTEMGGDVTGVPVVFNSANEERNDTRPLPIDEQLQSQVAQRTQPEVPTGQVAQVHETLSAEHMVTESHGTVVARNDGTSARHGRTKRSRTNIASRPSMAVSGSLAASSTQDAGPFPVEIWTHVLGFLPFSDVCRMTGVAKVFRKDVMNKLDTLYIDNEEALAHFLYKHFLYMRYGENVQELVFACIFEEFKAPVGDKPGRFTFQSWVDSYRFRLSPFVNIFKKLKYVFIAKGKGETKQEILRRLSLQGDIEAGYDYIDSIPRGHINFVLPRDDGDCKPAWILEQLAGGFFLDPRLFPKRPVRMVYGLPRRHEGDSCLGVGCTHEGSRHVPRVESKTYPGMFLPC